MVISYNRLRKLLIDKKMSEAELRRTSGISHSTVTKLNRDEEVAPSVLSKICEAIDADIGNIIEYIYSGNDETNVRCGII